MGFCPKCGSNTPDGAKFCTQCGFTFQGGPAPAAAPYQQQPMPGYGAPAPSYDSYQVLKRPVLDRGLASIIGYLSWFGFLVAMIGGDRRDPYAKHHFNNALIMHIFMTGAYILSVIGSALFAGGAALSGYYFSSMAPTMIVGAILLFVAGAVMIFTFVIWIIAVIRACRGNVKPVLLFGSIKLMK
mgnify:CR=1 FL=1